MANFIESFIGSSKGGSRGVQIHEGHRRDQILWCCRNCRHNQCRGRLPTIDGQTVLTVGEHNLATTRSAGEVIAVRLKMNNAAKKISHTTHDIVADCVSGLSDYTISTLPNLQHIKRTVHRICQRHQNSLSLPANHDSLVIDTQYIKQFVVEHFYNLIPVQLINEY